MTGINKMAKQSLAKAIIALAVLILLVGALLWLKSHKKEEKNPEATLEEVAEQEYKRTDDPIYRKSYELDSKRMKSAKTKYTNALKALEYAESEGLPTEELDRLRADVAAASDDIALERERMLETLRAHARMETDKELLAENEKRRDAQNEALENLNAAQDKLSAALEAGAGEEEIAALEVAVAEAEKAFENTTPKAKIKKTTTDENLKQN